MKQCRRCKQLKVLDQFNFKNKAAGKYQGACKECTRIEIRNHYYKNVQYYVKKAHKWTHANKGKVQQYIVDYLIKHPCIDCGESDPRVLEFDHIKDKTREIGIMLMHHATITSLNREILKCVVRCANCHRRRTAITFGWYKHKLAPVA